MWVRPSVRREGRGSSRCLPLVRPHRLFLEKPQVNRCIEYLDPTGLSGGSHLVPSTRPAMIATGYDLRLRIAARVVGYFGRNLSSGALRRRKCGVCSSSQHSLCRLRPHRVRQGHQHVPQHVGVRMDLRGVRRVGCRSGARWPTNEDVMHPQLESSQAVSSETRIAYGTASGWDVVPNISIERVRLRAVQRGTREPTYGRRGASRRGADGAFGPSLRRDQCPTRGGWPS